MPLTQKAILTSSTVRYFLAALSNQDMVTLRGLLSPRVNLTAYTGLDKPLGGSFHGPDEVVNFYLARLALRLDTKLQWSITLTQDEQFVLYGLATYGNPHTSLQRTVTLCLWFEVREGRIAAIHTHLDSAPLGFVLGELTEQPGGRVLTTISDSARQTLSFAGELRGETQQDFKALLDCLGSTSSRGRLELLTFLAPETEWLGPANQIGDHTIRLSGKDSIQQQLLEFDQHFSCVGTRIEATAQAEDTLALRLFLNLHRADDGAVIELPAFLSITMRSGAVVRVLEVYDSLLLLRPASARQETPHPGKEHADDDASSSSSGG